MATISNTPRPGYVWDATDNVWYPIGTGPHAHADYITSGSAINPNIVDAKGDIIAATAADTVARLAVGSNNQVLTADSSTATGLKWATPAASATSYALINTGGTALSGTTTTITGLSGYNKLMILAQTVSTDNNNADISVRFNSDTGSNYTSLGGYVRNTDGYSKELGIRSETNFNGTSIGFIQLSNYSPSSGDGSIQIDGANSTGVKILQIASGANNGFNSTAYDNRLITTGGYYKGTSVISSVSFISGNGSFDTGTIYIYGAN